MQTFREMHEVLYSLAGGVAETEAYPEERITKMRSQVVKLRAIVVLHSRISKSKMVEHGDSKH